MGSTKKMGKRSILRQVAVDGFKKSSKNFLREVVVDVILNFNR